MPKHSNFKLDSPKEVWEREYDTLHVIPSSTRTIPSKALLLFSELLDFKNIRRVLDAGCGPGRNAIYLARKGCHVDAVDFSEIALNQLHHAAFKAGVRDKIHTSNYSLETPLPFPNNSFDLVLDSYVSCHFINNDLKQHYRQELHRVTKPGGIVFSTQFSVEDEYYRPLTKFVEGEGPIAVDPHNGIMKRLYTEEEIKAFFSASFKLVYFVKIEFDDMVLNQTYRRSILALVLRK